jgi:hypothetical protein
MKCGVNSLLRTTSFDELLWTRWRSFGIHRTPEFRLVEWPSVSQERLCLLSYLNYRSNYERQVVCWQCDERNLCFTGRKWRSHRKLITPAFHFKILENFVDVFNANGQILLEKLSKHLNGPEFDIFSYIKLYTLDIISGTWRFKAFWVPIKDVAVVILVLYLHVYCVLHGSTQVRFVYI